jgi:demethylmenaquinone methyltransferase/2-methoxy-6-polyprenyl-1,4-benzoquinol methylase
LPYKNEFDKVFIFFVLYGFTQSVRRQIIRNAFKALKKNGEFFILDCNEFSVKEMPFYLEIPFKLIECPYAFDFVEKNIEKTLNKVKLCSNKIKSEIEKEKRIDKGIIYIEK